MESNKFFYKRFKAHQYKELYAIKIQNYAVIRSQKFIWSQSKLNIETKKFFNKSCKDHQPEE